MLRLENIKLDPRQEGESFPRTSQKDVFKSEMPETVGNLTERMPSAVRSKKETKEGVLKTYGKDRPPSDRRNIGNAGKAVDRPSAPSSKAFDMTNIKTGGNPKDNFENITQIKSQKLENKVTAGMMNAKSKVYDLHSAEIESSGGLQSTKDSKSTSKPKARRQRNLENSPRSLTWERSQKPEAQASATFPKNERIFYQKASAGAGVRERSELPGTNIASEKSKKDGIHNDSIHNRVLRVRSPNLSTARERLRLKREGNTKRASESLTRRRSRKSENRPSTGSDASRSNTLDELRSFGSNSSAVRYINEHQGNRSNIFENSIQEIPPVYGGRTLSEKITTGMGARKDTGGIYGSHRDAESAERTRITPALPTSRYPQRKDLPEKIKRSRNKTGKYADLSPKGSIAPEEFKFRLDSVNSNQSTGSIYDSHRRRTLIEIVSEMEANSVGAISASSFRNKPSPEIVLDADNETGKTSSSTSEESSSLEGNISRTNAATTTEDTNFITGAPMILKTWTDLLDDLKAETSTENISNSIAKSRTADATKQLSKSEYRGMEAKIKRDSYNSEYNNFMPESSYLNLGGSQTLGIISGSALDRMPSNKARINYANKSVRAFKSPGVTTSSKTMKTSMNTKDDHIQDSRVGITQKNQKDVATPTKMSLVRKIEKKRGKSNPEP